MPTFADGLFEAARLVYSLDSSLVEIVTLSLQVTFFAVAIACLIGFPLGALLAVLRFPGRGTLIVTVNAFMGLPPVVVGLAGYLMLSASGPLGPLGLLYTSTAMVIAQTVLVTPIIAAITRQVIADLAEEYDETLRAMKATRTDVIGTLLWDARFALLTAVLAGMGRALAEVGAVMIVGGNINHATRVMTTSIALETSKGDIPLALGLGFILLSLTLAINASAFILKTAMERKAYA